jgi:hypothetical protein
MKKSWLIIIILAALTNLVSGASLNTTVRNITDNVAYYQVEFGTVSGSAPFQLANQYLALAFSPFTGVPMWKIDIYTNNKNSTAAGDKGGLVEVNNTALRLPLAWKVNSSTGEALAGDPVTPGTLWQWMKDKNDSDWVDTRESGYTAVLTDSGGGAQLYGGLPCSTTVFLYLKGKFDSAAAGNYSGTIWFDMYTSLDQSPPVFTHAPLTAVIGRRALLVLKGEVRDDAKITYVRIHYKTDLSGWKVEDLTLIGPKLFKVFAFKKRISDLGRINAFYYALEASDGYNVTWFKSESDPAKIDILDRITFEDVLDGQFDIPDGNPDGGCTRVTIPLGALSRRIGLVVKPSDDDELNARPVSAFNFGPDGTVFAKPVTLALHYYDLDNDGNVEYPDGTPTEYNERDLRVFWWDGFEWRLLGGRLDAENNTLTIQTSHFSIYGIFARTAMTAADYRPKEKIITPATAGGDMSARFDGLDGSDFKITIFDVTGTAVRIITSPQLPEWDGKDEAGRIVESGVYIYQFEAEVGGSKKLISGTIIVAK